MPTFVSWTVSTLDLQDPPGIHQPMRVERGLDVAHDVELDGRLVHGGGVPLGGAEAMLCTDAAACGGEDGVFDEISLEGLTEHALEGLPERCV